VNSCHSLSALPNRSCVCHGFQMLVASMFLVSQSDLERIEHDYLERWRTYAPDQATLCPLGRCRQAAWLTCFS
jgi:hypothetical protein